MSPRQFFPVIEIPSTFPPLPKFGEAMHPAWIEIAIRARSHLSEGVEYIREASEIFGPDRPLSEASRAIREELLELFGDFLPFVNGQTIIVDRLIFIAQFNIFGDQFR